MPSALPAIPLNPEQIEQFRRDTAGLANQAAVVASRPFTQVSPSMSFSASVVESVAARRTAEYLSAAKTYSNAVQVAGMTEFLRQVGQSAPPIDNSLVEAVATAASTLGLTTADLDKDITQWVAHLHAKKQASDCKAKVSGLRTREAINAEFAELDAQKKQLESRMDELFGEARAVSELENQAHQAESAASTALLNSRGNWSEERWLQRRINSRSQPEHV